MDSRERSEATSATLTAVLDALFNHGPLTRFDVGIQTGLSRPSVSRTIAALLKDGTIEEVDNEGFAGRGRPSRRLRMSTRRAASLGIELGRRHVAIAVADITGTVVHAAERAIDPASSLVDRSGAALSLFVEETTKARIDVKNLSRVAVGTPGPRYRQPVGGQAPTGIALARLAHERALVVEVITNQLGVPVSAGNNTRYTALAEASRLRTAGGAVQDLIYLRIDEGIGGGVVIGGELCTGAWDAAGEMGHISVDIDGAPCFCGGRGCLEIVAALPAVLRSAGASDLEELHSRATFDDLAVSAIKDAATATGGVVAGVLSVINPSVFVLGGSVATLPGFLGRLEEVVRATAPSWTTLDLVFETAETDHLLGAIGAAAAAHASLDSALALYKRKI